MSEKRDLVFNAFNNKPVDRVPVGFWFHYTPNEILSAYDHPEYRDLNINGHKNFVKSFKPDFVKLMSDGYFFEPETAKLISKAKKASDLRKLEPIAANDKWIKDQVSLVKKLTSSFGNEVATFYNVFAPATAFKWSAGGDKKLAAFIKEDKEAVIYALSVIAQNTAILAREVIKTGKADGIYLSVQQIQDISVGPDLYAEVITPSELSVLVSANAAGGTNILHICGYEGAKNNLAIFKNYPAKVINFASVVEGISLKKGKDIFGGKAVIGGFENTKKGLLYTGSKEDVQKETKRLIKEAGKTGIILGADCTVPKDISFDRFEWVREAAK
jgi:uroporphyrinogen decarboxylase